MLKNFFKFSFFLSLALIIVAAGITYQLTVWLNYESPHQISIKLERGESLKRITQVLAEHQVVPDPFFFEVYIRLNQADKKIKAGDYIFPDKIQPADVLQILVKGQVQYFSVTIPEGYNFYQIGKIFSEKKITGFEDWDQLIDDEELIQSLNIPSSILEGYLYPDTYYYTQDDDVRDLIKMMNKNFWKNISPEGLKQAQEKGFNLNQWVTLASIIEKETGAWFERPLIASVFLNRMKIGMKLQTDPTVIYGIVNFDGNLTRRHLTTDHSYNTYTRTGLPPTPICSPGNDSLQSVLFPAQKDYLYFVSKGDGTHYFSKTLKQHNHAVRYYQLKRGSPPPAM